MMCITPAESPCVLLVTPLALILSCLILWCTGEEILFLCIYLRLLPSTNTMLCFKRYNAGYYLEKKLHKKATSYPSNPASDDIMVPRSVKQGGNR